MAIKFDVSGHPLLDESASELSGDQLEAQNTLAEELLGLDTDVRAYDTAQTEKLTRAVVLQVNFQLAAGTSAYVNSSESIGLAGVLSPSVSYKNIGTIDERAAQLVAQVQADYDAGVATVTATKPRASGQTRLRFEW